MSTLDKAPTTRDELLLDVCLRLADDRLVLGQRVSEWCGHGPELEEDLALANIALDLIGNATALYSLASSVHTRIAPSNDPLADDHFAYFRDDIEFKNFQICELPKGDFAYTIARQFLFSTYSLFVYELMSDCSDETLAGICSKHLKEIQYHVRHSREWVLRLGDGTQESHRRIQEAFDLLWMYTGELFSMDRTDERAVAEGLYAPLVELREPWLRLVGDTLSQASLTLPDSGQYMAQGGRSGVHTEHLGPLLAQLQILRRSHPDAEWT